MLACVCVSAVMEPRKDSTFHSVKLGENQTPTGKLHYNISCVRPRNIHHIRRFNRQFPSAGYESSKLYRAPVHLEPLCACLIFCPLFQLPAGTSGICFSFGFVLINFASRLLSRREPNPQWTQCGIIEYGLLSSARLFLTWRSQMNPFTFHSLFPQSCLCEGFFIGIVGILKCWSDWSC